MYARSYSELVRLPTMQERYEYLRLSSAPGEVTFGSSRYLNQKLYTSTEWTQVRQKIIVRDQGFDLGVEGYSAGWKPTIHHINPITLEQILEGDPSIFDPENLILCSHDTHNAIHFGAPQDRSQMPVERRPGDTILWR